MATDHEPGSATPTRRAGPRPGAGEILRAARRLLEDRGGEQALTLRSVAREARITAPSVYNHFADLAAVLDAVIEEAHGEYEMATVGATAHLEDPLEHLRGVAHAHIRFARDQPATYRMLFARHQPSALSRMGARATAHLELTITTIARCVPHGRPVDADARADGIAWWTALHGVADLPSARPRFPWPSDHELVERLVRRVVLCHRTP